MANPTCEWHPSPLFSLSISLYSFSAHFLIPFFFFLRGFWFHSRRQGKWGDRWRRGLASWISQNFILESSPFFTNKIYFGTVTLIQISRPLAKILIQQDFGGLISKCIMLVLHPLWRYFSPRVQFQPRYQIAYPDLNFPLSPKAVTILALLEWTLDMYS